MFYAVKDAGQSKTYVVLQIPQVAFSLGLQALSQREGGGQGTTFSNLDDVVNDFAVSTALVYLIYDFCLFTLLGWYLDKVLPREYGAPLPWYFFATRGYWGRCGCAGGGAGAGRKYSDVERGVLAVDYPPSVEPVPAGLRVQEVEQRCVQIRSLTKTFGSKRAVGGLDLDLYEGQIFALLGHNGAGKTTTLRMLGGMLPPSSGTAFLMGKDIRTEMGSIRDSLGFCPQHDVLYADLTVREHLLFYGAIKGLRGKHLSEAVDAKIREVDLFAKAGAFTKNLSGGMKRKLSVAIALIGDSKVVFLDEPTSGKSQPLPNNPPTPPAHPLCTVLTLPMVHAATTNRHGPLYAPRHLAGPSKQSRGPRHGTHDALHGRSRPARRPHWHHGGRQAPLLRLVPVPQEPLRSGLHNDMRKKTCSRIRAGRGRGLLAAGANGQRRGAVVHTAVGRGRGDILPATARCRQDVPRPLRAPGCGHCAGEGRHRAAWQGQHRAVRRERDDDGGGIPRSGPQRGRCERGACGGGPAALPQPGRQNPAAVPLPLKLRLRKGDGCS